MDWKMVGEDGYPERHQKHLVRREGRIALCTPCYGMHSPWWVEMTLEGNELEPINILPTDEHAAYDVREPEDATTELERLRSFVHAIVTGTCGGSLSGDETKRVTMRAIHKLEARTKKETGSFAMEDPEFPEVRPVSTLDEGRTDEYGRDDVEDEEG